MKTFKFMVFFVVTAILLHFCSDRAHSQQANAGNLYLFKTDLSEDAPFFNVDFKNSLADSANLSRLTLRLVFTNEELQFIKAENKKFRADYEVTVVMRDTSGNEKATKTWKGNVLAQNFDETVADVVHSTGISFDLPPGDYNFQIDLKDVETRRIGTRKGRVSLRDFLENEFMISDVSLLDSLNGTVADDTIAMIAGSVDSTKHFNYIYFEVYNVADSDSVSIQYEILGPGKELVQSGDCRINGRGRRTPVYIQVPKEKELGNNHHLKLKLTGSRSDKTVKVEKPISCACPGLKPIFANIDDAIEKLIYIADKDEIKKLKQAEGEQKIELFNKFWESRDPTPETRENEYMQEYYNRIEIANETFRGNQPGWKTEMGMVFVKLGSPDYIDKPVNYDDYYDPTRRNQPLLVWHYLNLRRRVIFEYIAGEYHIANYYEVFDILNDEMVF